MLHVNQPDYLWSKNTANSNISYSPSIIGRNFIPLAMRGLQIVTDAASFKKLNLQEAPELQPKGAILITHGEDHNLEEATLFDDDVDSLFDEPMETSYDDIFQDTDTSPQTVTYAEPPAPAGLKPAQRTAPPIPGLYFDPSIQLPDELAEELLQKCLDTYFQEEDVNQVMLFERVVTEPGMDAPSTLPSSSSGIPHFLKDLLVVLSTHLLHILPKDTHELLFPLPGTPARARQVIVNFYKPGEGITPHVDLLDRFGDGIIGVSLGSGCVMQFVKVDADSTTEGVNLDRPTCNKSRAWDVFLPHGSVYVMSDEARYEWTHGIDGRREDWVGERVNADIGRWVMRSIRVSVTFRWLLPGSDIVGGLAEPSSQY
ncbi:hypothetical protein BDY19DRAFT_579727 [Irpex rosettiformis]|uniref:Uncharacterized protein n=1 Tax=Irpex rosettiformis TaxID=378272 RepID=A0ACB8UCI5_9APHY|nr:hypothetical protein BDY19DRAFT_579727 [Irpex rosettiformis]